VTTTFYHDRSVRVTSIAIQVDDHVYPLDELTRIWHRRDRRVWGVVAGRGALGLVVLTPLVMAAIGVLVAVRLDVTATTRLTIIVGAVLVGLAAGPILDVVLDRMDHSFDRGSRYYEIWAVRGGAPVCLLRIRDRQRFGRIYRAVQRAVET
jgi:hypothetical protein